MAKSKTKKKQTKPLRKFSKKQTDSIEQMALDNCHVDTIAMALEIPKQTLVRRFGTYITQKRAEGRTILRRAQREKAIIGKDTGMLCFLGKNELGQTDKKGIELNAGDDLKSFIGWLIGRNGDDSQN